MHTYVQVYYRQCIQNRMGQPHCTCADNNNKKALLPKLTLYRQQMLTLYELNDKENMANLSSCQTQKLTQSYADKSAQLPPRFAELYQQLRVTGRTFKDVFYEAQTGWVRLGDRKNLGIVPESQLSKFCRVFKQLAASTPRLVHRIKPVYLKEVGLAVSTLYINGHRTQVLVDDLVPLEKMSYHVEPWILLLEKSYAKALGEYKYIQQLSEQQIVTEVAGLPHSPKASLPPNKQPNQPSFLQALKQLPSRQADEAHCSYPEGYVLNCMGFQAVSGDSALIRIDIEQSIQGSIRVVQPLHKYRQDYVGGLGDEGACFRLSVYWQADGKCEVYSQQTKDSNCTYLNKPWCQFSAGTYWLVFSQMKVGSRLSLVSYTSRAVRLRQIFSTEALHSLPFSL